MTWLAVTRMYEAIVKGENTLEAESPRVIQCSGERVAELGA